MAWNRPSGNGEAVSRPLQKRKGFRFSVKGAIAGAVVIIGAAVAAWWLWPEGETRQDAASTKRGLIKEVTPAKAKQEAAKTAEEKDPWKHFKTYTDTNGVLRYEGGMVVRKPPVRTVKVGDHTPSIFKHVAEMQIASLLQVQPGEMLAGTMDYRGFAKSLKESFEDEIVINPEDDERTRELKQAVIDTKKDLRARMEKGEDVGKLMSDTRADFQRLGTYKMELANEVRRILDEKAANEALSDQDVRECYEAANLMLEEKGLRKLRMPGRIFVRSLREAALEQKRKLEAEQKGKGREK